MKEKHLETVSTYHVLRYVVSPSLWIVNFFYSYSVITTKFNMMFNWSCFTFMIIMSCALMSIELAKEKRKIKQGKVIKLDNDKSFLYLVPFVMGLVSSEISIIMFYSKDIFMCGLNILLMIVFGFLIFDLLTEESAQEDS
jgi:hypothetical protein